VLGHRHDEPVFDQRAREIGVNRRRPPEPCEMTISRPLPCIGAPCQAIWSVKGPRLSVCASLLDG
jgi:hypothetical protein